MKNKVLMKDAFIKKSKISEKFLNELESAKIVKPSGFTENNLPLYNRYSVAQINHIKKLLDMGYSFDEINKITKKIGLPKSSQSSEKKGRKKKQFTIGGLAERVEVSTRTIKHWEEMGIIEADMRSEGGFRLYSEIYVYLCKLIKDLQLFGYSLEQIKKISDHFRTFLAIESNINRFSKNETEKELNRMLQEIKLLFNKMNLLKEGINRWEELLNKKTKEINNFKRKNQKRVIPIKGVKNA
jgi:DNA-binding transcriptional MerR regulator